MAQANASAGTPGRPSAPWAGPRWRRGVLLVALLVLAGVALRLLPLTAPGRRMIAVAATGIEVGRLGRLEVRGVTGDIWRDFRVDSLAINDAQGAWLRVRDVRVRWRWADIFARRLHIQSVTAGELDILRRPVLGAPEPSGRSPLSLAVDSAVMRVTTAPAFSLVRGDFNASGRLFVDRRGPASGLIHLTSRLHSGDFLQARFNLRKASAFLIEARVREAQGGAIAGAAGLAADKPFDLSAFATGGPGGGRLQLTATSGESTPASAAGTWSRSGGQGVGRIELADSRLLSPLQSMVGPVANIAVVARPAGRDLYVLDLSLAAANLRLSARGLGDVARRATGPRGIAVDVGTANAGRFMTNVSVGPAVGHFGLGGAATHWVLAGRLSAASLAAGGYSLARLTVPVRLEAKEGAVAFDLTAAGEGGAGGNLTAALLGARPTAQAQGTLLADGRTLVRALAVVGPGLKLTGSGRRDLMGGLDIRGDARFTNLAFAHAAASGAVAATWRAGQSAPARPWTFTLDAKGERLATGYAEADRLLGATPRLTASGQWRDGELALATARLEGAAGSLDASGLAGAGRGLALKLDWRARGPFDVGPIELAGAINGTGAITGTFAAPKVDLAANLASIDTPGLTLTSAHASLSFAGGSQGLGHLTLAADSAYGPARADGDFLLVSDGVDLTAVNLDAGGLRASGSLALRAGAPSAADLAFSLGPGAFLASGQASGRAHVTGQGAALTANLTLTGANLVLRGSGEAVKSVKFAAAGPLDDLPFRIAADGGAAARAWRLDATGRLAKTPGGRSASFTGDGRFGRATLATSRPAELVFASGAITAKARLAVGGDGVADFDVRSAAGVLEAKAVASNINVALLNQDFTGRFDADGSLSGRGATLAGALTGRLTNLVERDEGGPPIQAAVKLALAGGELGVTASLSAKGMQATSQITLPAEASAAPFRIALDRHRPMAGRFAASGEVGPLWTLFTGADRSLTGQASVGGTLAGDLADPKVTGTATLADGAFDDGQTGLKMRHVALAARLVGDGIDVGDFSAADAGSGRMTASGQISLARSGASTFRLQLRGFRLIDNETAKAEASGEATINRAADGRVQVAGSLKIDHALISPNPPVPSGVVPMEVVEVRRPAALPPPDVTAGPDAPSPVALDVAFNAPGGIFVKGRGLNVELSLDAHVGGSTAAPTLTGVARVVRGDYSFAGRRFQLDDRGLVRLGATAETIRLDLTATREDPSLTAVIKITGTAAKPRIELTSTPVLPPDEILSQVLFGASAARLSGLEAAQLASALSGLAGGGGFDVMGDLGKLAHLDTLSLGQPIVGGGSTVSGGKYLRDNVYIELTGGSRQAAQVEWRARKHLSIISRVGDEGDSQLSVSWRRDF